MLSLGIALMPTVGATRRAVQLMRRPRPAKLARCPRLRQVVESKLELRWSPQQIAAWLKISYPDDPEMRVSHETIYLSLFVQSRGRCARNWPATCAPAGPGAGRAGCRCETAKANCAAPSTSPPGRPGPPTGPVPGHLRKAT
jgi:hypothetical protein